MQTVTGPVSFDSNGKNTDTAASALIFQWQPGQGGSGQPQFVQVLPKRPRHPEHHPLGRLTVPREHGTESTELTWEPSCEPSPTASSKAGSMA